MLLIRLIQLTVFSAVCVLAFAQDDTLGDFARGVEAVGKKSETSAGNLLAEMR